MRYRYALGEVLREIRTEQRRTLRWVSDRSSVALGYLSEVERGQKEISSELLDNVAEALGLPTSRLVIEAGYKMSLADDLYLPNELRYESVIKTSDENPISLV